VASQAEARTENVALQASHKPRALKCARILETTRSLEQVNMSNHAQRVDTSNSRLVNALGEDRWTNSNQPRKKTKMARKEK
jgi:hypothetical protein